MKSYTLLYPLTFKAKAKSLTSKAKDLASKTKDMTTKVKVKDWTYKVSK